MLSTWSTSLLVCCTALRLSVQASAQPLIAETKSIESTVANADLVFVARIEKFEDNPTKDRLNNELYAATVAIEETLKKFPYQDEMFPRLQIELPFPRSVIAEWQRQSCRLLVALDGDLPAETQVIELTPGDIFVMTEEMSLLHEEGAVLEAAKNALLRFPAAVKRIHIFRLFVPRELFAKTPWEEYGYLQVSVPVNEKLEKRAQDYLESDDPQERSEGARALRYFRSEANAARLRPLLEDSYYYESEVDPQKAEAVTRTYTVRRDAYQTLQAWGFEVVRPVISEELSQ